jgi:transposase
MPRPLSQVVRDLTSVTGLAILHALIAGERDPLPLAKLRPPHGHPSEEEMAQARPGTWRAEPLLAFQQAVAWYPFYHQQLTVCAPHLHAHLGTFTDQSDGPPLPPQPRRHQKVNEPRFEARPPLYRLAGGALTTMEGLEEGTALVILSESGPDMRRWPRVKPLCSGLGRAPPQKIAGGRGLSRPVRPGAQRVPVALRLAARTVPQAHTALGAF